MRSAASSGTLVGREAELRRAERLLDEALAGHGALLLLSGESGIGKSALAAAIGQRAQEHGATVAVGRCYETGGMPAFAPWQDLLTELHASGFGMQPLPPPFGEAPT